MYYVYIDRISMVRKPVGKYWKAFVNYTDALLFAKINGYKLIAKGKE
jgi:hypothetical protein